MLIEVIRDDGALARKRWRFMVAVDRTTLLVRLRDYVEETRKSTRHRKWSPVRAYWFSRHPILGAERVPGEPPCPDDVKAEAVEQLAKSCEFLVGHLGWDAPDADR